MVRNEKKIDVVWDMERERDEWGASAKDGTGTWVIVDYDHEKFLDTFFAK